MTNASISFDRAAGFYDQTRGFPPGVADEMAALAMEMLDGRANALEIGVGTGRIAKPLLARGLRLTGIDLSRGMMRRIHDDIAGTQLAQADMTRLPFADASFDAVVAVHVLHLVGDWRATIAEARRALRPGGALLLGHNAHLPNAAQALRTRFNDLTAAHLPRRKTWAVVDEEVVPALQASGAGLTVRTTLVWTTPVTPREEIEAIRNRVWSSTWDVGDEEMAAVLPKIERFALVEYGSLDAPIAVPQQFEWRRFVWP